MQIKIEDTYGPALERLRRDAGERNVADMVRAIAALDGEDRKALVEALREQAARQLRAQAKRANKGGEK